MRSGDIKTDYFPQQQNNIMKTESKITENEPLGLLAVMCRLFGHKWRYNFSSIPNKAICKKCYAKSKLNLRTLDWEVVSDFENEKRTDEELADKWF